MAQNPYTQAEARLDRANADFNRQSGRSKGLTIGGLVCFGLGLITGRKELMAIGLGCAGMGQATRLDSQDQCRRSLGAVEQEIAAVQRDQWRVQRAIRAAVTTKIE